MIIQAGSIRKNPNHESFRDKRSVYPELSFSWYKPRRCKGFCCPECRSGMSNCAHEMRVLGLYQGLSFPNLGNGNVHANLLNRIILSATRRITGVMV